MSLYSNVPLGTGLYTNIISMIKLRMMRWVGDRRGMIRGFCEKKKTEDVDN
jgi:hypothetical protein